jgi:hypothetical protein
MKLKCTALSNEDSATLDSDREFARTVLEVLNPKRRLTGTASDIPLLQEILDGGPYTDSAEDEVIALGTSFGDVLARALDLKWVRLTDEDGSDIGLRYRKTSLVLFPRDMIIKRIEQGEEPDLQHLFDGVVREVKQLIASGDCT